MGQVRISDELHQKVKEFTEQRIGGIGEWVEKWIKEGMDREKKGKKA